MDSNLKQSLSRLLAQYNTMHLSGTGHDNRYYTRTQVDELMSSIASTSALTDLQQELQNEITRATSVEKLKAPLNSPAFEGIPIALTAALGNSTQQLATTEFVQLSIDDKLLNSDAMIIKGTLGDGGTISELPSTYKVGWTYKIISAGKYAGQVCEVGDLITAFVDREEGDVPDDSDWSVNQTNIDGALTDIKNNDNYISVVRSGDTVVVNHNDVSQEYDVSSQSLSFGGMFSVIRGLGTDSKGHVTSLQTTTFSLPSYQTGSESAIGLTRLYSTTGDNTNGAMTQKATTEYLSSHTHNYAGSSTPGGDATNALKLSGYSLSTAGTKDVWGTIPSIGGSDGVMEVGKYIDFHCTDGSTTDYDVRIEANTTGLTISGTTKGTFSGSLSGNATSASSCSGNSATATALTTSAGAYNKPVYFSSGKPVVCSYTLAGACEKSYIDGTAASSITSSGTSLMTERAIYYGLPTINGSHSYTSSTNIYAPTSVGTSGYVLKSGGSGAPSWVAQSTLAAGTASKLATTRTLTIGNTGKTFDGSGNVSWSLSEIGAAASSHSHSYIPLSGSTAITGALKWNSTNHGIYVSGSYTQIGDLSGNNGGYTQIMNDCQAKYGLVVSGTLTASGKLVANGLSTLSGGASIAYFSNNPVLCNSSSGTLSLTCVSVNAAGIIGNGNSSYSTGGLKVTVYSTSDGSIASTYGEVTGTADNTCNLGQYHTRWANVYAATGTVSTSDRNLKDNIEPIDDKYKNLLLAITPVSFTFKDGTSGRTHIGFIAQDVEDAMENLGMTGLDFAGFCKDAMTEEAVDENGAITRVPKLDGEGNVQYMYSLRYSEFTGILASMVQDLYAEVKALKNKLSN